MPQHDLILDNGSGAAFRADANNALAALGSNMKGPNAPPVPIAGMLWVDDDSPSAGVWTLKFYDGAEWIEIGRLDVSNNVFSVAGGSLNRGTAQNTTSGSQIEFTGIPSGVRRVTILFDAVSTTGSSDLVLAIGGASIETSGYSANVLRLNPGGTGTGNSTANFILETGGSGAGASRDGRVTLENITGTTWIQEGKLSNAGDMSSLGSKTITGALERLRISTADTFDAGVINIMWEF